MANSKSSSMNNPKSSETARDAGAKNVETSRPDVLMVDNYDSFTWNVVQYFWELGASVDEAIRSLQFEDIASQALGSLKHNVDALNEMAFAMEQLANEKDEIDVEKLQTLKVRLSEMLAALQARNSQRTVAQVDMDEGDIELF